jgi:hypothetical protein
LAGDVSIASADENIDMVRNRLLCVFAASLLLVLDAYTSGCSKSSDVSRDVDFACETEPKAPHLGRNTFTVTLNGPNRRALAGANVSLEGDMSHPGMRPVFGEAKEINPGRYQGTLDLPMPGDWTVLFHITLPNGQTFDREMKIQNLQAT